MKVLFINSVVDYGSTGKIVRDLANGLKQQGHDVLICFGRGEAKEKDDTFYFGGKMSSALHLLMSRLFGRHGLHSNSRTYDLIDRIKLFNPDIIHLHNIHGYYLNYKILFKFLKDSKSKVIWTLHDCWSFSGSAAHFDYYGCSEWDDGCVVCNNVSVYPKVVGFSRQKKNFDEKKHSFTSIEDMIIICPSNWLRDLTSTTFLSKFKVNTIYNGIDTSKFPLKSSRVRSSINLLGVANDWSEQKGINDFFKLAGNLPSNFHITLIGLSKRQLELVPANITAIERTSNIEELCSYYQKSDIYINLSVEETMGLTTVEAMAVGTPVIVYDKTAVPEVVTSETGLVVSSLNFDQLVDSILTFDFNNYDSNLISEYAQFFSKERMLREYMTLYI